MWTVSNCYFCLGLVMELKEFIKQSIIQITEAIVESNEVLKDKGAIVNPGRIQVNSGNSQSYGRESNDPIHSRRIAHKIEFNVAVTVSDEQQGGARAKISVMSLNVGAEGKVSYANISESRINFMVPILYPEGNNEKNV